MEKRKTLLSEWESDSRESIHRWQSMFYAIPCSCQAAGGNYNKSRHIYY